MPRQALAGQHAWFTCRQAAPTGSNTEPMTSRDLSAPVPSVPDDDRSLHQPMHANGSRLSCWMCLRRYADDWTNAIVALLISARRPDNTDAANARQGNTGHDDLPRDPSARRGSARRSTCRCRTMQPSTLPFDLPGLGVARHLRSDVPPCDSTWHDDLPNVLYPMLLDILERNLRWRFRVIILGRI
jgi:hypothetical protein